MLSKQKTIFEYWSHAASYLPMKDFRYSLFRKYQFSKGNDHWYERDKKMMRFVLNRITREGPLQSKDFVDKQHNPKDIWSWKPAKRALEQLFMEGRLMTTRRIGFQKVYDLTERVIPPSVNTTRPTRKEYCRYLIIRTLTSFGIANKKEIKYLQRDLEPTLTNVLKELLYEKKIRRIVVQGSEEVHYMLSNSMDTLGFENNSKHLFILSPFDNLIIQRDRLEKIFDFDYLLECYVPEQKRKYGYFCLPILYGSSFAGRLDAKADRRNKVFYIKNIWLENDFSCDEAFIYALGKKLSEYANFCHCDQISVLHTERKALKLPLQKVIEQQ